jgi:N-methylhydantoinase A/oxoprolinase/acetone carboxylase beta subunit
VLGHTPVLHVIGSYKSNLYHRPQADSDTCRKGGPLAVTDANLMLGRLIPDYFPKIFGKSEKEPLDVEASASAFEKLANEINSRGDKKLGLDEIVYG